MTMTERELQLTLAMTGAARSARAARFERAAEPKQVSGEITVPDSPPKDPAVLTLAVLESGQALLLAPEGLPPAAALLRLAMALGQVADQILSEPEET